MFSEYETSQNSEVPDPGSTIQEGPGEDEKEKEPPVVARDTETPLNAVNDPEPVDHLPEGMVRCPGCGINYTSGEDRCPNCHQEKPR